MRSTEEYLDLIEPQHAGQPNFEATVALSADVFARLQVFLASLIQAFDVDYAVGVQLDAVGARVGRSRYLTTPLQGLFFTWGDPNRGWARGVWRGIYSPGTSVTGLDDDTYRRLIKAKVLANTWDGTVVGEQEILDTYFTDPATLTFVEDGGISEPQDVWLTWSDPHRGWNTGKWKPEEVFTWSDPNKGWTEAVWSHGEYVPPSRINMIMTIGVAGKVPSLVDLALLGQGLITAKPAGVKVAYRITSVDNTPVFGWGVDNEYVAGWGTGSWGVSPEYIAAHAP